MEDKILHLAVSFAVTIMAFDLTRRLGYAILITIMLGMGKELLDAFGYGNLQAFDLVANGLGVLLGGILIFLVENRK